MWAAEQIHAIAGPMRAQVAEFVGKLMAQGADSKHEAHGLGVITVPVERVRAIVFGMIELAHVLALGDPDGGPFIVETLATMVRNELGASSLEVIRNEIARGVIGKATTTATMIVPGAGSPVGQA